MKRIILGLTMAAVFVAVVLTGCGIDEEVHNKTLRDLKNTQKKLADQQKQNTGLQKQNAALKRENEGRSRKISAMKAKITKLNQDFIDAMKLNDMMQQKLEEKGASIENLQQEKDRMDSQRQKLLEEQKELLREREALTVELERLRRMKKAAERRNAEYRQLMAKLKKMIDAGTLSVKIRDGRMIVSLSSDVLFPSGRTKIRKVGREAVKKLAETLNDMEDRHFLVVGHTDDDPIHTRRYPSNWELSTQRAIEVVKMMVESGVSPKILTAAGHSRFDPLGANDTPEHKEQNRRVEIVFMPRIEELPGFNSMDDDGQSTEHEDPSPAADAVDTETTAGTDT